jgi:hypothetical protein
MLRQLFYDTLIVFKDTLLLWTCFWGFSWISGSTCVEFFDKLEEVSTFAFGIIVFTLFSTFLFFIGKATTLGYRSLRTLLR